MVWLRPEQPLHVRWSWRIEERTNILTQARKLTVISPYETKGKQQN
jgi:hypothetical protein